MPSSTETQLALGDRVERDQPARLELEHRRQRRRRRHGEAPGRGELGVEDDDPGEPDRAQDVGHHVHARSLHHAERRSIKPGGGSGKRRCLEQGKRRDGILSPGRRGGIIRRHDDEHLRRRFDRHGGGPAVPRGRPDRGHQRHGGAGPRSDRDRSSLAARVRRGARGGSRGRRSGRPRDAAGLLDGSTARLVAAGALVGIGARPRTAARAATPLRRARGSKRSFAAVATFMALGMATVLAARPRWRCSMNARMIFVALGSGLLFGAGLAVAGLTRPEVVIGFLDVTGRWDPTLGIVMFAATGANALLVAIALRRRRPLWAKQLSLPHPGPIDRRLLAGRPCSGSGGGSSGSVRVPRSRASPPARRRCSRSSPRWASASCRSTSSNAPRSIEHQHQVRAANSNR